MKLKEIKKLLKSNYASGFLVYIGKYKIKNPINRKIEIQRINRAISSGVKDEDGRKIETLKGLHAGEKCIIVGNGPSARMDDIDVIARSGMATFGANRIMDIFGKTIWRPTYLTVLEPSAVLGAMSTLSPEEYVDTANRFGIQCLFLNDRLKRYISADKHDTCYFLHLPLADLFSTDLQPFSDDASFYVSDLGNVTTVSIQMAVYMGYSTIYLYGMDNTYIKYIGDDGRFHVRQGQSSHMEGMATSSDDIPAEKVPNSFFQAFMQGGYSDARKMNKGFSMCHQYANEHGIQIINLTHGGELNEFPRKDFNEVFA